MLLSQESVNNDMLSARLILMRLQKPFLCGFLKRSFKSCL